MEAGVSISGKRVERLMRAAGIAGVSRRRFARTTIRDERAAGGRPGRPRLYGGEARRALGCRHHLRRNLDRLYLAVVLDAFSRKIVGWAMAGDLRAQLVPDALNMAIGQRRPREVIHHSDQGSQCTSVAFGRRCREAGVRPSMGLVGDAYDNAMCASFFETPECELLQRRKFQTEAEARMAVFVFIEGWYNPSRRRSALGCKSPVEFETSARDALSPVSP